ncbi:MAG TPA: response regulator [Chthoniobacterales bacterium]|jgi:DNA-binding response OmpR family regulator|nr:response regulator [Chthoniobacterales bacterium]
MANSGDRTDPRILLVEDEKDLAQVVCEILHTLPAKVIVARNGREAIRLIESEQAFDLVLLDLVLPQLSGLEVLRRLRRISTSAKVILSTGYIASLDSKDLDGLEISGLLNKPYMPNELLAAVRAVLWPEENPGP